MNALAESLFSLCEEKNASDIHLAAGCAPRFRIGGELVEVGGYGPFDERTVDAVAMELGLSTLPPGGADGTERVRMKLAERGSLDGMAVSASGTRYRFNIFHESGRTAAAVRRLDSVFRSFAELGLPRRLEDFCAERDGLFVATGPAGSGKSTTLATMIDTVNRTRRGHIITIEDPVEFVHAPASCLVHQRQVGRDAAGFDDALVEALRQDPDVILVGEMRDLATARAALRASETGHLVFTTMHAGDTPGAVGRFIALFPPEEQAAARRRLALSLRGVLAQHLLPRAGGGRLPAWELLVNTPAAANLIASGRDAQLHSVVETGAAYGMKSLDACLSGLVAAGLVAERDAAALTRDRTAKKPEALQ